MQEPRATATLGIVRVVPAHRADMTRALEASSGMQTVCRGAGHRGSARTPIIRGFSCAAPGMDAGAVGMIDGNEAECRLTLAVARSAVFDEVAVPLLRALAQSAREAGCQRLTTLVDACAASPFHVFGVAGLTTLSSLQVGGAAEVTLAVEAL